MMKKEFLLLIGNLLFSVFLFAGHGDYAVSKIAPALFSHADAVVRVQEITFEILNTGEAVERNHYVITINNENGKTYASYMQYYDRFRRISSIEGFLYDADGKQLKKIRTKDVEDISGVDAISLMDDNRIKHHDFYYKNYPYTIEYEEVIHHKNTFRFPTWVPQKKENIAVEHSEIAMICNPAYLFRYKAFHCTAAPAVTMENGKKVSTWLIDSLPALPKATYASNWYESAIHVLFAPTDFTIEGYHGNMTSWREFGKFIHTLNQGRDILPVSVKQTIHQLIDGTNNIREKVHILYEYMQKNTRYISIQLGIGGWQPFDASYVATKGYGDCKALTNYMYSMLREAGIASYYTLINAGKDADSLVTDFPSGQQFNHVILCVPNRLDTIWLECTSQTLPAGYLSSFTSNRYALLIAENGGLLVHTPVYNIHNNLQTRKITASLQPDATLTANVTTTYKAEAQDVLRHVIHLPKDEIETFLKKNLDLSTYNILHFDYQEDNSMLPAIQETLGLVISNYASITDKRLFIAPNLMSCVTQRFSPDEKRTQPIVIAYAHTDIDTIEINIPEGYVPESMPRNLNIETSFGVYISDIKMADGKIYFYRCLKQYSGTFDAKEYINMVTFYNAIYKADRDKMIFIKKESN